MNRILILAIQCSFLIGCINGSAENNKKNDSISFKQNNSLTDRIFESDTFKTNSSGVYFLMPDDKKIEEIQMANSEENYNEIIADLTWYPGIASEVLDSFSIHNQYLNNQHVLIFVGKKGNVFPFDKDSIKGNMILFRNDTIPIISDAISFERESTILFFGKK